MREVAMGAEEAVGGGLVKDMLNSWPVSGGEDIERDRSTWRIERLGFSSRGNGGEGLVSGAGVVGGEEIPDAGGKEKDIGLGSNQIL